MWIHALPSWDDDVHGWMIYANIYAFGRLVGWYALCITGCNSPTNVEFLLGSNEAYRVDKYQVISTDDVGGGRTEEAAYSQVYENTIADESVSCAVGIDQRWYADFHVWLSVQ